MNDSAGGLGDQAAHAPLAGFLLVAGRCRQQAGDRLVKGLDSGLLGRHRLDDRHIELLAPQLQHVLELLGGAPRQRQVGLVHHQHVGDFQNAGFHRLNVVAHVGCVDHHAEIGDLGHLDFRLAGADGLDDDEIAAGGVHDIDDAVDALRQTAEVAARRHGANEDVGIFGVAPHPHAVAENGAAGDRA